MNDSCLAFSGNGAIEGTFRDSDGRVLLQFGKSVWADLIVHTEMLTLRKRLLVAAASRWASFHSFFFQFHSKSVMTWVAMFSDLVFVSLSFTLIDLKMTRLMF